MYATCLFCHHALGRNEAIERFPVGRRLAFDAAKGRLWVVCPRCERWNLTPLEERWEAIEAAERLYRDTRRRVATEHVGLARLAEGLELVRIGRPLRPELAAWRYGDQFGRRRRQRLIGAGAVLAGGGLAVAGGLAAGAGLVVAWHASRIVYYTAVRGFPLRTVARLTTADGGVLRVQQKHLAATTIGVGADGLPSFSVQHAAGRTELSGDDARRAAAQLFPAVNRAGGTPEEVRRAVERIERAGDAERFYAALARRGPRLTRQLAPADGWSPVPDTSAADHSGLFGLSTPYRLAIEMAVHEEAERRALEGELAGLERAWRDAEEVAAIADDLLLSAPVRAALRRLQGRAAPPAA